MTCTLHTPPPLKDVAGLHTCAEIIRDIYLGALCTGCGPAPVAPPGTGPQYPRPPHRVG
ncbi:hypothetical protein [Streptomyces uncialis]|uniref:hypothetical protein n=1 Tax=Streptomyces uncialis TaxID=1048205 RepID=UPI0033E3AD11